MSHSSRRVLVAVDGPSGSGKSSVSREVARRAGLAYLDTGAMYRAACWAVLHEGLDVAEEAVAGPAARAARIEQSTDPDHDLVLVDGHDVTQQIREAAVTAAVSAFAAHPQVREEMRRRQREVMDGAPTGCIAEGRDITTVVAPDADVRVLLTADPAARVRRRAAQLAQVDADAPGAGGPGGAVDVREAVLGRDERDARVTSFATAADGVLELDSSALDLEQTVLWLLRRVEQAQADDRAEHRGAGADDVAGRGAAARTP